MSGRFGAPGERWNEMDFERLRRVFLARQGGSEVALDPGQLLLRQLLDAGEIYVGMVDRLQLVVSGLGFLEGS